MLVPLASDSEQRGLLSVLLWVASPELLSVFVLAEELEVAVVFLLVDRRERLLVLVWAEALGEAVVFSSGNQLEHR